MEKPTEKPDAAFVLTTEELATHAVGVLSGHEQFQGRSVRRALLEQCSNGLVVRIWFGPAAEEVRELEDRLAFLPVTVGPEPLAALLKALLAAEDLPPLGVVRQWSTETPQIFWEVAQWAQIEWAHTHPIKGLRYPRRLSMPKALSEWRGKGAPPKKKRESKKGSIPKTPEELAEDLSE